MSLLLIRFCSPPPPRPAPFSVFFERSYSTTVYCRHPRCTLHIAPCNRIQPPPLPPYRTAPRPARTADPRKISIGLERFSLGAAFPTPPPSTLLIMDQCSDFTDGSRVYNRQLKNISRIISLENSSSSTLASSPERRFRFYGLGRDSGTMKRVFKVRSLK